jgi:hypothetical protein
MKARAEAKQPKAFRRMSVGRLCVVDVAASPGKVLIAVIMQKF